MANYREANNELRKKIENYSYGLRDYLWQGEGYSVFNGLDESRDEKVAIRVVDLRRDATIKDILGSEIDIIKRLKHGNVLRTLDVFSTVNNCYIITDLCPDGSLQDRINQRGLFQEFEAIGIFKHVMAGWLYLLKERIIHGSLEPKHLLFDHNKVVIGGFSCSRREGKPAKKIPEFTYYQSPESTIDEVSSFKGDIWSLGTILYMLIHGNFPWQCNSKQEYLQKAGKTSLDLSPDLSAHTADFLKRTLTPFENRLSEN